MSICLYVCDVIMLHSKRKRPVVIAASTYFQPGRLFCCSTRVVPSPSVTQSLACCHVAASADCSIYVVYSYYLFLSFAFWLSFLFSTLLMKAEIFLRHKLENFHHKIHPNCKMSNRVCNVFQPVGKWSVWYDLEQQKKKSSSPMI